MCAQNHKETMTTIGNPSSLRQTCVLWDFDTTIFELKGLFHKERQNVLIEYYHNILAALHLNVADVHATAIGAICDYDERVLDAMGITTTFAIGAERTDILIERCAAKHMPSRLVLIATDKDYVNIVRHLERYDTQVTVVHSAVLDSSHHKILRLFPSFTMFAPLRHALSALHLVPRDEPTSCQETRSHLIVLWHYKKICAETHRNRDAALRSLMTRIGSKWHMSDVTVLGFASCDDFVDTKTLKLFQDYQVRTILMTSAFSENTVVREIRESLLSLPTTVTESGCAVTFVSLSDADPDPQDATFQSAVSTCMATVCPDAHMTSGPDLLVCCSGHVATMWSGASAVDVLLRSAPRRVVLNPAALCCVMLHADDIVAWHRWHQKSLSPILNPILTLDMIAANMIRKLNNNINCDAQFHAFGSLLSLRLLTGALEQSGKAVGADIRTHVVSDAKPQDTSRRMEREAREQQCRNPAVSFVFVSDALDVATSISNASHKSRVKFYFQFMNPKEYEEYLAVEQRFVPKSAFELGLFSTRITGIITKRDPVSGYYTVSTPGDATQLLLNPKDLRFTIDEDLTLIEMRVSFRASYLGTSGKNLLDFARDAVLLREGERVGALVWTGATEHVLDVPTMLHVAKFRPTERRLHGSNHGSTNRQQPAACQVRPCHSPF
ncbi:Hypothetical protein, putative [Bodo saltans]|uniref:NYN domain-containing protein n=1 Tax=Bodo saltans TaxID=75058 RepID=A0A0S4IPB5_BODSA|nr:Hypothetical protein, putative [Bodo saltans]|eukprot:CUE67087.1 Hypothetical protein, putative [Bodo saltans]